MTRTRSSIWSSTCSSARVPRSEILIWMAFPADEADRIRKDLHSIWARVKRDSLKPGQAILALENHQSGPNTSARTFATRTGLRRSSGTRHRNTIRKRTARMSHFRSIPGRLFRCASSGPHLSKRTIRRQIPIYEESAVDRDLVDEGERNLVSYFQSKGYFDVKVSTQYNQLPDTRTGHLPGRRGRPASRQAVYFQGNHYLRRAPLEAVVAIKKGHSFLGHTFSRGKFSDTLLRKSVRFADVALYKDAGFANVSVTTRMRGARSSSRRHLPNHRGRTGQGRKPPPRREPHAVPGKSFQQEVR